MKIRWFKVFILMFNPNFRWLLEGVILYAINNYAEKRGTGASDVLWFKREYWSQITKGG